MNTTSEISESHTAPPSAKSFQWGGESTVFPGNDMHNDTAHHQSPTHTVDGHNLPTDDAVLQASIEEEQKDIRAVS